jgi:hypothetical protein
MHFVAFVPFVHLANYLYRGSCWMNNCCKKSSMAGDAEQGKRDASSTEDLGSSWLRPGYRYVGGARHKWVRSIRCVVLLLEYCNAILVVSVKSFGL